MPVAVVAPYIASNGALCAGVTVSTFHAALVANASSRGVDVALRPSGGAAFARVSDDATACDASSNASSSVDGVDASVANGDMRDGFTFVATVTGVRGAMDVRVVREDVNATFARDASIGAMSNANATTTTTIRVSVPSRRGMATTPVMTKTENASSTTYVESIVFLETSGVEDAFARVTSMSIERDATTTSSGAIDDEMVTWETNETTTVRDGGGGGGGNNNASDAAAAMTLAAEALAAALANASGVANGIGRASGAADDAPQISATIDGGDTFVMLWVLLAALACVIVCGALCAYLRRRQRAEETRAKTSAAAADAAARSKRNENKSKQQTTESEHARGHREGDLGTRANAHALASHRYRGTGTLPPLFAHMNALSLSRQQSSGRQARVERLDSLGVAAAALVDRADAPIEAHDDGDGAVTLDVNRTVDSEENHRVALDIDSSRAFAADDVDVD